MGNLNAFFKSLIKKTNSARGSSNYQEVFSQCAEQVREKIFSEIMVRRTRSDINNIYKEDMEKHSLFFPEIKDPKRIIYPLSPESEEIFDKTIELISKLKKVRYDPVRYLKIEKQEESRFVKSGNLGAFFRTMLVKRLESSTVAFKNTLARFIDSYKLAIEMYKNNDFIVGESATVSSKYFDLEQEDLEELVKEEKIERYEQEDFQDNFIELLQEDLDILIEIQLLWNKVTKDEKFDNFQKEINSNPSLNSKKLIIFSESKETAKFLFQNIGESLIDKTFLFTGDGGENKKGNHGKNISREIIKLNFDPNIPIDKQKNDIEILIATDVLAEGVNLHRGNIVINYDLPWNPTRVIQRVGRVNRIGTKHKDIHIFNLFPSSRGETILNQEENIVSKIQAMHRCLGNDARYLTESEDVGSYKLFGGKDGEAIFKRMSKGEYYGNDGGSDKKLEYLVEIRKVRDEKKELFERIKRLPKKIKSSKKHEQEKGLITYMERGRFKSFLFSDNKTVSELNFLSAIEFFKCKENTKREPLSENFYGLLTANKNKFESLLYETGHNLDDVTLKTSEGKCMQILSADIFTDLSTFTEEDIHAFKTIKKAFNFGKILPVDSRNIWKNVQSYFRECEDQNKSPDPIIVLNYFRELISSKTLSSVESESQESLLLKKQIILSLGLK